MSYELKVHWPGDHGMDWLGPGLSECVAAPEQARSALAYKLTLLSAALAEDLLIERNDDWHDLVVGGISFRLQPMDGPSIGAFTGDRQGSWFFVEIRMHTKYKPGPGYLLA